MIAVGVDAVLAQRLAMIASDDDRGLVPQAQGLELVEHTAEVVVGEPDLAVVKVGLAVAKVGRLGVALIVEVRVIEVHPKEELLLPVFAQKRDTVVGHLARGRTHRFHGAIDVDVQGCAPVVVVVDAALEAAVVGTVEVAVGVERRSGVAEIVQRLADGAHAGIDAWPPDGFVPLDG